MTSNTERWKWSPQNTLSRRVIIQMWRRNKEFSRKQKLIISSILDFVLLKMLKPTFLTHLSFASLIKKRKSGKVHRTLSKLINRQSEISDSLSESAFKDFFIVA